MAGPKQFIFGDVDGTAGLSPSCDSEFGYIATMTGFDGTPVAGLDVSVKKQSKIRTRK